MYNVCPSRSLLLCARLPIFDLLYKVFLVCQLIFTKMIDRRSLIKCPEAARGTVPGYWRRGTGVAVTVVVSHQLCLAPRLGEGSPS